MKKRAFTLMEILVVLAIVGAMAALSIYALGQFRRTIQLSQATSEVMATIKETENLAKNNTLPQTIAAGVLPYSNGYFLVFKNNTIYRVIGQKDSAAGSWYWLSTPDDANTPPIKASILQEIQLIPAGCSDGSTFESILFINLTGDVMYRAATGDPKEADVTCDLQIKHSAESTVYKVIEFNIKNDTYKIKNLEGP